MSKHSATGSTVSTVIGLLIACALLFVGFYGVYTQWFQHYQQIQGSKSWKATPCIVTAIKVEMTSPKGNSKLHTPRVAYEYQYAGRDFSSDRFWFGNHGTSDGDTASNAASAFQAGGNYECFVKPANPKESVLVRQLNPDNVKFPIYYFIAASVGGIMFLGHFIPFLVWCMGGTTVSEKILKRAMANATCPIESGEPDEPLVIEAAESRVAVAIGLWIAGTCWTGIVFLIYFAIAPIKDWIPLLIFFGFFLAGIALLVFGLYSTLQVFNPSPILACSQRDIYPGSEFELSWMFRGNAEKIKHLEIVLEGIEKVSYRQGTSTRTEEKPFFRQSVVKSEKIDVIAKGFELVSIPASTMHSFESSNNSFKWQIRVLGKISFWPDIRDRFEIVLLAPKPEY